MVKKFNKCGYMLIEIILASSLAFVMAYFIINITIKLKNKNDDLFVETLVATDKSIITNRLVEIAADEGNNFSCSNLKLNSKKISYGNDVLDIVSDYATIGSINEWTCNNDNNVITIKIPLSVKQLPDKNFDVDINYIIKSKSSSTCDPED